MSFAFMPFYTGDYLRDTRHLTPMRHGVYLLLLMHCWDQRGPVPLDEQESAGIANCRSADEIEALRYVLNRYFVKMDDGWYNKRMQAEIERSEFVSKKREDAGRRGANERMKRLREAKKLKEDHGLEASAKQVLSKCLASDTTPTTTTTTTTTTTPTPTPTPNPPVDQAPELRSFENRTSTSLVPKPRGKPRDSGHEQNHAPTKPNGDESALQAACRETWRSYSEAYAARYGTPPVRNAKVNASVKSLVQRLGADEAPKVAAWFVSHSDAWYVRHLHDIGSLLHDAEKLRTQWATGHVMTAARAAQIDQTAANLASHNGALEILRSKGLA